METAFIIASLGWNTGLVAVAGYLVKNWMDKQEEGQKKLALDLKESVAERKVEIREQTCDLTENLNGIYEQLRISNGRTSKIEGEIGTIRAVCAERHEGGE